MWPITRRLTFTILACFIVSPIFADIEIPLPRAMAVLGDSISEGMLSDFSLERPPTVDQIAGMALVAAAANNSSKAELMNAFRARYANVSMSWATGYNGADFIDSHFERLRRNNPNLQGFNFSVSGAVSSDIATQVSTLLRVEEEKGYTIDYITLLIGANDLGQFKYEEITSPVKYAQYIEEGLRRLLLADTRRNILVVGLPKIIDIFKSSKNLKAYKLFNKIYTCQEVRNMLFGDLLFFRTDDQEAMNQAQQMMNLYRDGTLGAITRLRQEFPEANFKTVFDYKALNNYRKLLSIDCFHPSNWGQAQIADVTWMQGFWPGLADESDFLNF